ncbi:Tripeptidyl-peptidase 2 [Strongyloides ratti]|uniref:Tripeptidyl-peptidase 2 n=1 Tax=Strongyloides ratti TaxID=34506 RepID=A0A090LHJ0_STRRB|nr:Tripeptidyl-peptidase 2 [Strongyloides ratti]CEF69251.1 Tripeptidyl-peptidase 2 [Strongyloides ratti]
MDEFQDTNVLEEFPVQELIPKIPTQQKLFLDKYPEYDGRNVLIAILDTGVDVSLPSLQVTTTGERKIIDVIDCSGAGDVDMSKIVTPKDGVIIGLTGRKLKIPESWDNPSGKYHIGIKNIYELYSKDLVTRVNEYKKENIWKSAQNLSLADVRKALSKHEEEIGGKSEKIIDKTKRDDLIAQLEFLKNADKYEDDEGPVADIIAFQDSKKSWKICLDTSYRGRLGICSLLSTYKESGEYAFLNDIDKLSYSFTMRDNGNLLEIVTPIGSHGSHVANIAAGHYPDNRDRDGMSPGAQIVSMCIGDSRLGSIETGAALMRAFNMCIEMKVDIVNLSYGEAVNLPNEGRIIEAINTMVNKYGITFLSSAGNNGPALSTGGCPGSTTSSVISVGACVTNAMSESMYSIRHKVCGNMYPWSSRGPNSDGWLGVSIVAPGGAICGVPKYCAKGNQLMNGTSMSSPNAVGAVSCLISALKEQNVPISPFRMRMMLENTALPLDSKISDPFGYGKGLVQIDNAFEYAKNSSFSFIDPDLTGFEIRIGNNGKKMRGVYLREKYDTLKIKEHAVSVVPKFNPSSSVEKQIGFEANCVLTCKSSFVKYPKFVNLPSDGKSFSISVDPTQVPPGTVKYTEILGFETDHKELGPLFTIPITVINPMTVDKSGKICNTLEMIPSISQRLFVDVPNGCSYFNIKLKNCGGDVVSKYIIHCVQLIPSSAYRNSELFKFFTMEPDQEVSHTVKVQDNYTVEISLTKFWHCIGNSELSYEIEFFGLKPALSTFYINSSNLFSPLLLTNSNFNQYTSNPTITFKKMSINLKPFAAKIEPLGSRDLFYDGTQIFKLQLNYNLSLSKTTDCVFDYLGLSEMLYESGIDHMLIQVFSDSKKYIHSSSSFTKRFPVKLEKGDYKIQAQLRHESDALLEKYQELPLTFRSKLSKSIDPEMYTTPNGQFVSGTKKISSLSFQPGESKMIFISSIPSDKLPKEACAGTILNGTMSFVRNDHVNAKQVVRYPCHYIITYDTTAKTEKGSLLCTLTASTEKESKESSIKSILLSGLSKASEMSLAQELLTRLITEFSEKPEFYYEFLRRIQALKHDDNKLILETCDNILKNVDEDELFKYFGKKQGNISENDKLKKIMEDKKKVIIAAYIAKFDYIVDSNLAISTSRIPKIFRKNFLSIKSSDVEKKDEKKKDEVKESIDENIVSVVDSGTTTYEIVPESGEKYTLADVNDAYNNLIKWIDEGDAKILLQTIKYCVANENLGLALKYLNKLQEDKKYINNRDVDTAIVEITETLGWIHISNSLSNKLLKKYPVSYRLF